LLERRRLYVEQSKVLVAIVSKDKAKSLGIPFTDIRQALQEQFNIYIKHALTIYPSLYELQKVDGIKYIYNKETNRSSSINIDQSNDKLMEILAEHIPHDLSILGGKPDNIILLASITLFPVGWKPSERVGYDIKQLHRSGWVPEWAKNIGTNNIRNFASGQHVVFDKTKKNMSLMRTSIFVDRVGSLVSTIKNPYPVPLKSDIGVTKGYRISDLRVRRELQTFIPLLGGEFVSFGVHTFEIPFFALNIEELRWIVKWATKDNSTIIYHDVPSWLPVLNKYIIERERNIKKIIN
jgi:Protein of unknown function (DUF3445)